MLPEDTPQLRGQRRLLVRALRQKGISDKKVLDAIGAIPRHYFFESAFYKAAYQDRPFAIGEGQTISQPFTVARQTELLNVATGNRVLEVGTGSGYQAAVLAYLGAQVYTIEFHRLLYLTAKDLLGKMAVKANFFNGDGSLGLPQYGPYDRILVTAGAPVAPDALLKQLTPEGILVIPVGNNQKQTMLKFVGNGQGGFSCEDHGEFLFVPLRGKQGWDCV